MPHITWKCDPMWILFVVEWLVMIIIFFLPFSFCQPKVDFLLLWWSDRTVINCVHSLRSMGHSFFTWQLHNASWLHNMDVVLLVCLLYILDIFSIQPVTNLHCVSVENFMKSLMRLRKMSIDQLRKNVSNICGYCFVG